MSVERAVPGDPLWAELSAPHLARYQFAVGYAAGGYVLDAGAGVGYGAHLLHACGADSVVGIDIDPEAIGAARRRFRGDAVDFLVDDCHRLDLVAGPFDLICSFENIEHLEHPERFLVAAGRRLGRQGVLLVSTPDRAASPPFRNGRPRNQFHHHEWYLDEFQQMLSRHFNEVEIYAQVRTTSLDSRRDAVKAVKQALTWCNPLAILVWRKLLRGGQGDRPWKKLAGLAAPTVADYPIVRRSLAPLLGTCEYHVAICRDPRPAGFRHVGPPARQGVTGR